MTKKAAILECEQELNRAAYAAKKAITDPTNQDKHVAAAAAHIAEAAKAIKAAAPAKASAKAPAKKAPAKKAAKK